MNKCLFSKKTKHFRKYKLILCFRKYKPMNEIHRILSQNLLTISEEQKRYYGGKGCS